MKYNLADEFVFSPDGRTALAGDALGNLVLWELESGQEFGRLDGHAEAITGIAFSADGRLALTGSRDGKVRCWRLDGAVR